MESKLREKKIKNKNKNKNKKTANLENCPVCDAYKFNLEIGENFYYLTCKKCKYKKVFRKGD